MIEAPAPVSPINSESNSGASQQPTNQNTSTNQNTTVVQSSVSSQAAAVAQAATEETTPKTGEFATPGVKTFEEYLEQAKIPEVHGVAGRVIEVLKRRIGNSPLSIGDIATELNLSKRTLQRRLQQQELSFAELRDKIRFNHSIDYLIEHNTSIDSISGALDFSDRTSFTNAFKRWTGLSPSTFRKLFRDFA